MLQQTQVDTVVPYYRRFLKRFPTVRSLAKADIDEVLLLWSGLGYYSRARSLHHAAQVIIERYRGGWPRERGQWMALPGIGRYTAGAILSIAFDQKIPVVDGNVMRVLCRLFALEGDPRRGGVNKKIWNLAEELLPSKHVGDFNQSLIDLGATVCTPSSPRCLFCPCRSLCKAYASGDPERFPEPKKQPAWVHVQMAAAVMRSSGKIFLCKREEGSVLGGLWEFPTIEVKRGEPVEALLRRELAKRFSGPLSNGGYRGSVEHSIMNRRLKVDVFEFELSSDRVAEAESDHSWVPPERLDRIPISSLHRKIAKTALVSI